ncbi:ankyrin repeat domain-containing protein [Candidatus Dependentiae bacterium]|nr:ankyrin repeat domain-containing protein [Candidatus Dependentiae bacterium]
MKYIQMILLCFVSMQILTTEKDQAFYPIRQKDAYSLQSIFVKNFDFAHRNNEGQTILHIAVIMNNWQAVKVILKSGFSNINQLDKHGKTAMDYAVEYGYRKMVKKLIKKQGKVTSLENAIYTKELLSSPFKKLLLVSLGFFIGAIVLMVTVTLRAILILNFFECLIPAYIASAMIGLSFVSLCIAIPGYLRNSQSRDLILLQKTE